MASVNTEGIIILSAHEGNCELCVKHLVGFHLELLMRLLGYPSKLRTSTSHEIVEIHAAEPGEYNLSE